MAAIDARCDADGWYCYVNGGRIRVERTLFDWAREVADRGAGEIKIPELKQYLHNEGICVRL